MAARLFPIFSLRFKLMITAVAAAMVLIGLLVGNSIRLIDDALVEDVKQRVKIVAPLLSQSLREPLANGDFATAENAIREIRMEQNLTYLIILNPEGQVVASVGWDHTKLPTLDTMIRSSDQTPAIFNTETTVVSNGKVYGTVKYGVSQEFLIAGKQALFRESSLIGGVLIILLFLLLLGQGFWLTRNLALLTRAGEAITKGDYGVRVPVTSNDEVGQLSYAFNAMAQAVQDKIRALREGEAKFHAIADYSHDLEIWINTRGKLIWVNPAVRWMLGFSPEECLAMEKFPEPIVADQDVLQARKRMRLTLFKRTAGQDFEFRLKRKDGSTFWAAADWLPIYDNQQRYLGIRISVRDVDSRKKAEGELHLTVTELQLAEESQKQYLAQAREEQARLSALLSAMNIGILFVGRDNKVLYTNPAFYLIWMIRAGTVIVGMDASEVLRSSVNAAAFSDRSSGNILRTPDSNGTSEAVEIQMADGRLVTQLCYPVRDDDKNLVGHLWIYEDITRERQTADQLIYLAERDALTGLYNRHRFQEELNRLLADAERHGNRIVLLFFDLDEFKYINDTFGHRAGDAMLIRVAGEVSTQIRRNEVFSRLGGDEFAVLAPEVSDEEAQVLAERIVRSIARIPFQFEGHNLRLTTSVGIAVYPDDATTSDDLVAHADAAMYQAKEAGKNTWRMYSRELDVSRHMVSRLSWNERIHRALEHGLLRLHFQGVYETDTRKLSHLEALVRMVDEQSPEKIILPGNFIPIAEKTGKILDIDRWVITTSIQYLKRSQQIPPIAVNISGRSFNDPSLPQFIAAELKRHNVAASRLLVELTETSAVSDMHDAHRFIEALRRNGCLVCLDDFGAGFSSFAYLKHLQADILKIDGQFIQDLPNERDNQVFVKAIVDVAKGLHKITIAECVEDEATLLMLQALGVDKVQGYHIEMPQSAHPAISKIEPLTIRRLA